MSDDSIIGTLATIDVSTLTTTPTLIEYSDNPITVPSQQDIRVSLEYSGGDINNRLCALCQNTDVKSGVSISVYSGSWSERSTQDFTYTIQYGAYQKNSGTATVADGGTITHYLSTTPVWAQAQCSVAGEYASITTTSSTTITIAIKDHAGNAGTEQTIYWRATTEAGL